MSALWWVLCWRVLAAVLLVVTVLASGVYRVVGWVRLVADAAEVEMLLALALRRARSKGARK